MTFEPIAKLVLALCLLVAGLAAGPTAAAADKAGTGLYLTGDRSGFFLNPTMDRVYVQKVDPDTPAARSGFLAGDEILEIESRVIPGQKAKELFAYWASVKVRKQVKFLIRRHGAEMILHLR